MTIVVCILKDDVSDKLMLTLFEDTCVVVLSRSQ